MKKEELQGEGEQQDGVPDSETGRSWLVSQGHHILTYTHLHHTPCSFTSLPPQLHPALPDVRISPPLSLSPSLAPVSPFSSLCLPASLFPPSIQSSCRWLFVPVCLRLCVHRCPPRTNTSLETYPHPPGCTFVRGKQQRPPMCSPAPATAARYSHPLGP